MAVVKQEVNTISFIANPHAALTADKGEISSKLKKEFSRERRLGFFTKGVDIYLRKNYDHKGSMCDGLYP